MEYWGVVELPRRLIQLWNVKALEVRYHRCCEIVDPKEDDWCGEAHYES